MGALVITCRKTGNQVFTGIEMDEDSFAAVRNVPSQIDGSG
jgi:hypothetical protein